MATLNNDLLDEPLIPDKCLEFTGGVNRTQTPNFLQANQVTERENYRTRSNGISEIRPGTRKLGAGAIAAAPIRGLCYYDTPAMERLVTAVDGRLSAWDGETWSELTGFAPDNAAPWVEMVQGIDRLYISDGVNNVRSWNGSTFIDEGNTNDDPPHGQLLLWFTQRLLVAGVKDFPDTLFPSDLLDGSTFDRMARSIRIGAGEGSAITALCGWDGFNVVVGKENSIYVVVADPTITDFSEWQISIVHKKVGCVSHRTMCQVGSDVWFLSRDGVKSVRRLAQEQQNEVTTSISDIMGDIIDRINEDHFKKCNATFWNNAYYLSVPLDDATEPNYVLVYNTITQSWEGHWTMLDATAFAVTLFNEKARLVFGDANGKVRQLMDRSKDGIFDDDGEDIPTALTGRGFVFGDPDADKTGFNVEVKFYKSKANATLEAILDEQGAQIIEADFPTQDTTLTFPITFPITFPYTGVWARCFDLMSLGRFNMLQVRLTTRRGYIAVRSIVANAFIEGMTIQK